MRKEPSFVITLQFDAVSFERLQILRLSHFPQLLNLIPAHLTLLHSASLDQTQRLKERWREIDPVSPPSLRFTALRSLGRGTAIVVEAPMLGAIRSRMMHAMEGSFSPQDQQVFKAHVTIQNKVDAATARSLLERLAATFTPWEGCGRGLMVWRYLGGPWSLDAVLSFTECRPAAGHSS